MTSYYGRAEKKYGPICSPKEFGQRLGAYLYWNRISVDDLAEKLLTSPDNIKHWIAGMRFPHPDDLESLSKVLGVSIGELLSPVPTGAVKDALDHTHRGRYIVFSAEKVLALQDQLNISCREATKRCGFNGPDFFARLRREKKRYANRETLEAIARAFGVTLEDLL